MPAQPTMGLVHRLVGNPQSMIGQMIRRGSAGKARPVVTSKEEEPASLSANPDLDVLEKVLDEIENTPIIEVPAERPVEQPVVQPAEPLVTPPPTDQSLASQLAAASAEGVLPQVVPQVMQQTADALDPALTAPVPVAGSLRKEIPDTAKSDSAAALDRVVSLDQMAEQAAQQTEQTAAAEIGRTAQAVEVEPPSPEISPEVESYLQEVKDHQEMAPQEVVIADGSQTQPAEHTYPAQPVVVLPITPTAEKTGERKNAKFSVRWLVEWSRKLMKMFVGKVVYRPITQGAA